MECIVNKNDFKSVAYFQTTLDTGEVVIINPLSFEWEIQYFTCKLTSFKASYKYNQTTHEYVFENCTVDEETGQINISVNSFDFLQTGVLKSIVLIKTPDESFTDGYFNFSLPETTLDITIV